MFLKRGAFVSLVSPLQLAPTKQSGAFVSTKGRLCFSSPAAGSSQTKASFSQLPLAIQSPAFVSTKGRPIIPSNESCNGNSALCVSSPARAASVSLLHPAPFASLLEPAPTKQRAAFVSLLQPARAEQRWPFVCLEPAEEKKQRKQRWPFVETKGASLFYNGIFPCRACGLSLVVVNCSLSWLGTSSQNCLARHTISRAHCLSKTEFVQDLLPKLQVAVVKTKLSCETSSTSLRLK